MKTLSIIMAAALLAAPAFARIGETEAQCAARYGQVVSQVSSTKPDAHGNVYTVGNFRVAIYFLNGKASCILVSKFDKSLFTRDELEILMGANSGGLQWIKISDIGKPPHTLQEFARTDERARLVIAGGDQVGITSAEWQAASVGMRNF